MQRVWTTFWTLLTNVHSCSVAVTLLSVTVYCNPFSVCLHLYSVFFSLPSVSFLSSHSDRYDWLFHPAHPRLFRAAIFVVIYHLFITCN